VKSNCRVLIFLFFTTFLFSFQGFSKILAYSDNAQTQGVILYVKPGSDGCCANWNDACELQTALDQAIVGSNTEIWVAAGTYKPITSDPDPRKATFQLKSGVAIYGGFPDTGEPTWAQRNWEENLTTLSGDLGNIGNKVDNSYHVVTGSGVDSTAILDGFTITAGNANVSSSIQTGGGMHNIFGSPMLKNLMFTGNSADRGGGLYNSGGRPILDNVTFSENSATYAGGGMYNNNSSPFLTKVNFNANSADYSGGGMYNSGNSNPTLTNVTFNDNTAYIYGGGMTNWGSGRTTLNNVTFSGNSAQRGGGLYNYYIHLTMTNVTFSGNFASETGGGISNINSNITVTNTTFFGNSATLMGGGIYNFKSNPQITNAIIWGNTPDQIMDNSSTPSVNNSAIQGGYPGTGNIEADPLLGSLADNGGFTHTHSIDASSPAIDTGSTAVCPVVDQRSYMRPIDGDGDGTALCDMGAYEYGASEIPDFALTVEINGGGTVVKNPDKPSYQFGDVVTLTAKPDPAWNFSYWGGDIFATENPLVVIITGNMSTTAIFYKLPDTFLPFISR